MRKILVFGFGMQGRQLVDQYLCYSGQNQILAIIDNYATQDVYQGILVIRPAGIACYAYDEIWVCTVYYQEIKRQLTEEYGIPEEKIVYAEPVMPILDERLRGCYKDAMEGNAPVPPGLEVVLGYMKSHPARMYCYPFWDEYFQKVDIPVFYDEACGLFYVHYKAKRMYLSRAFDTEQKARVYFQMVLMEQDSRSPHCYRNGSGMKGLSGNGIDVGAAEGIFALEVIDRIDHICLVEADEGWVEALRHTFEPYREKVAIVHKFASDRDGGRYIRLDSLMKGKRTDFIKIDVEGEELKALEGCRGILRDNHVRLAVCVYHRPGDNARIGSFLEQQGYHTKNSEGYVVCQGEWELEEDHTDFRRALLFAHKED